MKLHGSHQSRNGLMIVAIVTLNLSMVSPSSAAPIRQGNSADASCEVVSVGQWYCTIDGKGYYCDTKTNPDPNKNCRPARMAPSGPKGALNQGLLQNRPIMRRGIDSESPTVEGEQGKETSGDVKERAVKRPDPRPKPPIPPKGPHDPQVPPIGPGGTGPTTPK